MVVIFIVIGVLTVALLVAALLGWRDIAPAPDPVRPFGHQELPEGGFAAAEVGEVRFDTVLRGYKMSEVDGVLDRLQERQAQLEEQVRVLGGDPVASSLTAHEAMGARQDTAAAAPEDASAASATAIIAPGGAFAPGNAEAERAVPGAARAQETASTREPGDDVADTSAKETAVASESARPATEATPQDTESDPAPPTRREAKRSRNPWRG